MNFKSTQPPANNNNKTSDNERNACRSFSV